METLSQLMIQFSIAEEIDPEQVDSIQTGQATVEQLRITMKDGSERMFYHQVRPVTTSDIMLDGETIRRKSSWHRKK